MNVLLDKEFLKELDNFNSREIYARITALTSNELPIEMIEGRITGGSINIDGASAVRRTCSLSLVAQDININEFYWGLENKIKVEIGLRNFINSNYSDIIWFPQGIYIITGFNTSMTSNTYNISISGQDKMCLLNGNVGGSLPASIDFGVEEIWDNNDVIYNKIPIHKIIREMIHAYALEPYHNIIINDLDDKGLELLEYRGDIPMYLLYHINTGEYVNMKFNGKEKCYISSTGAEITLDSIPNYNKRIDELLYGNDEATIIKLELGGDDYLVSKVEFGQTAGYRLTDLVYPGDLISGIGESITSILDKIVKMLGNFEYFYDLDGRFIFQSKKTYINTNWSPIIEVDEDSYVENASYIDKNVYYFNGNNLISSFSNNPNLTNIKNDYSIWGIRKSVTGAELPIHFRYAIQKKPIYYKTFEGKVYYSAEHPSIPEGANNIHDWRELIYQMALDYFKYNQEVNFYSTLIKNNLEYYPTGMTGYEQFYTDMQGFWRRLYDPNPSPSYYQYEYELSNEKTFSALNNDGEILSLLVKDHFTLLKEEDNDTVDKNKVYVFKNGELYKLIDTVPINYNFDENGNQQQEDKYYITDNTEIGYKLITENFYTRIEKKEIYVRRDGQFKHILDTVSLKPVYDENGKALISYYLKETLTDNRYNSVLNDLPAEIKSLYFDEENNIYNKYYTTSQLGLNGEPIVGADMIYNYFTYYISKYDYYQGDLENGYWNISIKENPDLLNFWIDFLDGQDAELNKYSIYNIGNRPKVVNDQNVKSIYYRNIPNLIFTSDWLNEYTEKTGYVFVQIDDDSSLNYFNISAQGKSAKDALDELLYNHSYCTESINISAIPVYYLDVNTRISVCDELSKINGEYIVSRISLSLNYNGQMSIQATKAPQRFN